MSAKRASAVIQQWMDEQRDTENDEAGDESYSDEVDNVENESDTSGSSTDDDADPHDDSEAAMTEQFMTSKDGILRWSCTPPQQGRRSAADVVKQKGS